MKNHKKLVSILLAMVLMLSFTACGGTEQPAPEVPQQNQAENTEKAEPDATAAPAEGTTENASEDTADAAPQQPAETIVPEAGEEKTPAKDTAFNAAEAVAIEAVSKGVKYTFNTLPQTAADVQALVDEFGLADRHNTVAFFMASFVKYAEDADEGLAMIDVVKGPQPLSDYEKAFIKERLSDKKYLPKSYFEGAKPENNYEPESPWTIVISDEAVSAPEGYSYTTVSSGGADSPRRVCLRIKGDNHYLWEYNGVLLGIRLPAEEDPWL